MGLDMHLMAEKYISEYSNKEANEKVREASGFSSYNGFALVKVEVGYWRKANQIHGWFVDNVQDGVDDCGTYQVSREKIAELLELCETAVREKKPMLEPRSGFFFGSVDVDEYYWSDMENTINILSKILDDKNLSDCEFYYRSSW